MDACGLFAALDRWGFVAAKLLLGALWQSTILFAAVATIVWALRRRRPSLKHGLSAAALLAAPLLPLLAWAAVAIGTPRAEVRVMPAYEPVITRAVPAAAPMDVQVAPPLPAPSMAAPAEARFALTDYPWAMLLLAYAAGLAGFVAWVICGHWRIGAWTRGAAPVVDEGVLDAFRRARTALGVKRDFVVLESAAIPAPFTAGALRTVVLLPMGFAEKLAPEELAAVALHETAHVKRRDPLTLALVALVRAALFFHPLVWLAARRVSLYAEQAADDAVLDSRLEPVLYARALTRIAENITRPSLSAEVAAGILISRSAFLTRIEAILSDRRDEIRRASRWVLAATAAAAVVSLMVAVVVPLGDRASAPIAQPAAAASMQSDHATSTIPAEDGDRQPFTLKEGGTPPSPVLPGANLVSEPAAGTAATAIQAVTLRLASARSDEGGLGSVQWETNLERPTRIAHGMYVIGPRGVEAHVGASVSASLDGAPVGRVEFTLVVSRDEQFLQFAMRRAWLRVHVDSSGTLVVTSTAKQPCPASATLVTSHCPEVVTLTDEAFTPLWWTNIVEDGKVTKTVAYIARVLGPDEPASFGPNFTFTTTPWTKNGDGSQGRQAPAVRDVNSSDSQVALQAGTPSADQPPRDSEGVIASDTTGEPIAAAAMRLFTWGEETIESTDSGVPAVRFEAAGAPIDTGPILAISDDQGKASVRLPSDVRYLYWFSIDADGYAPKTVGPLRGGEPFGTIRLKDPIEISGEVAAPEEVLRATTIRANSGSEIEYRNNSMSNGTSWDISPEIKDGRIPFHLPTATGGVKRLYEGHFELTVDFGKAGKQVFKKELTKSISGIVISPEGIIVPETTGETTQDGVKRIFAAAESGDSDAIRKLLSASPALANARDDKGRTPLHIVAASGRGNATGAVAAGGANPNARDNEGQTPLHYAAQLGHEGICRLLIEYGADPSIKDNEGRTAFDLAKKEGHADVMEELTSRRGYSGPGARGATESRTE